MHSAFYVVSARMLVGALCVEFLIFYYARQIGEFLGIMDHPDLDRKRHAHVTPLVGGIAIMIPLLMWTAATFLWGGVSHDRLMLAILPCGSGAMLVGYADDQSSTSPSSRVLSLLLLVAIALTIEPRLAPTQLNWGDFAPLRLAPGVACCLMAVSMAGFVNAVNMADGQNGIVTGMFVIWSLCLFAVSGAGTQVVALGLFATSLVAFLFNMAGRAFLGDSGTYGVTFVFGVLAISAHNSWGVTAETITIWFFIPVMDCFRLMFTRVLGGRAPSDPDRNHFHHRLQDRVGKNFGLLLYLGAVGVTSLLAALMSGLSMVCILLLTAFYFSLAWTGTDEAAGVRAVDAAKDAERFGLAANSNNVRIDPHERKSDGR